MNLVFLEASNGLKLSKTIKPSSTLPYPNVKLFNSYHEDIELTHEGWLKFESLLREHSEKGHCLHKGRLKAPLNNQSRAGVADKLAYTDLLVLDVDNAKITGWSDRKPISKYDLRNAAELVIAQLPNVFQNCSYIVQASSSLGLKPGKLALHIFMFLDEPVPPKALKLWLKDINHTCPEFERQITLSNTGQALSYRLDASVADNSKLIFIAPPTFEDGSMDPFENTEDRIVYVKRESPTVALAPLVLATNPEKSFEQTSKLRERLRSQQNLPKRKPKLQTVSMSNQRYEVLTNPDRMSITVVDTTSYPFIRCNVNGGDSNAYYFNAEDPIYMHNFKDEPIFSIEQADKEFFSSIPDLVAQNSSTGTKVEPPYPVVLRDFNTDTYYNGIYDPNIRQFTDDFPLTITNKASIESFMRSHGRAVPDFIPDARVVFDPENDDEAVDLDSIPYYVNLFRRTKYMQGAERPKLDTNYGTAGVVMQHYCPTIRDLVMHMLGDGLAEFEHFINWLAYIYQTKKKSMTAWVFGGVPGTGKGLFANRVLRPLFGEDHVSMKALENIEEQFNLYMRSALFLVVDEFRMVDAKGSSVRMADKLKNQITEPTLTIRAMRSNQIELPSYTNFIFLTNRADAIKIEPGDRRYNVAPRQETRLEEAKPNVIENLDLIEKELFVFAGLLAAHQYDARMARTCMNNSAKSQMRAVSMSVFDEFCQALNDGDVTFFVPVLDIEMTNTFDANRIASSQRLVKAWIASAAAEKPTRATSEQLRIVYHVLTEHTPQIAPRQFSKMLSRNSVKSKTYRDNTMDTAGYKRGIVIEWNTPAGIANGILDEHLNDKEKKALLGAA